MTHVLVTVVCRNGRVIFTRREEFWFRAWRYANHFRGAFDGDIYVVTPHGWGGMIDRRGGYEPALGHPGRERLSLVASRQRTHSRPTGG